MIVNIIALFHVEHIANKDSGDPRQARTGLARMTTGKDDKGFCHSRLPGIVL